MAPAPKPIDRAKIAAGWARDGFYFPLDVLTRAEAKSCRAELEALEHAQRAARGRGKLGNKAQLNNPHLIFRFADRIARHPRLLDAVETLLGPDLLVWGSTFFIKEPNSRSYVSWHQDLHYWGLDGEAEVSAWVALSPVTEENGCMRFLPGSHLSADVEHADSFDEDNFLTRGQQAQVDIDEDEAVLVELKPGQASLHHGRLLHASSPNQSDERRIGLVINYIAPEMRQVIAGEDFAVLVRGEDRHGHFTLAEQPKADLDADGLAWHRRVLEAQNQALYAGAEGAKR